MKHRTAQHWTPHTIQTEFEVRETAVYQSTNVKSIRAAYRKLLSDTQPELLRHVLTHAGPARIVNLVLRGYEIPDARTRLESIRAMLALAQLFASLGVGNEVTEQYWLILAQQRDVLLERVEDDLAALNDSELPENQTRELEQTLCAFHAMLRAHTDTAVSALFAGATHRPVTS